MSVALCAATVDWNSLPAIRSAYFTLLPPPETTPLSTERLETGTPSCAEASLSSAVRAAAAAPRMLVAPIALRVEPQPTANALIETLVSSCAAVTCAIERPSSSAAICRIAVGVPWPSSATPWNSVTVLSGFTWSHESICVGVRRAGNGAGVRRRRARSGC